MIHWLNCRSGSAKAATNCATSISSPSAKRSPLVAGYSATEAPRGLLYHRYTIDDAGIIRDANIVPPTSQNQKTIEDDLRRVVATRLDQTNEEIQYVSEQAIRNYDPCISCSTHFLKLEIDRA